MPPFSLLLVSLSVARRELSTTRTVYAELGGTLVLRANLPEKARPTNVSWDTPVPNRTWWPGDRPGTMFIMEWGLGDEGLYTVKIDGQLNGMFNVVAMTEHVLRVDASETQQRFTPNDLPGTINNITWFRSGEKTVECLPEEKAGCLPVEHDDVLTCKYYGTFEQRAVVDTESGELTLRELDVSDYGALFTLRVNENFWLWKDSFRIEHVVYAQVGQTLVLRPIKPAETQPTWYSWRTPVDRNRISWPAKAGPGGISIRDWRREDEGLYTIQIRGHVHSRFSIVAVKEHVVWPHVGETLRFVPSKLPDGTTGMTWIRNDRSAAACNRSHDGEWNCNYWGSLKGRAVLDVATGKLTIRGCQPSDYGDTYILRVNNNLLAPRLWGDSFRIDRLVYAEVGRTLLLRPILPKGAELRGEVSWDIPNNRNYEWVPQNPGEIRILNWTLGDEGLYTVRVDGELNSRLRVVPMGEWVVRANEGEEARLKPSGLPQVVKSIVWFRGDEKTAECLSSVGWSTTLMCCTFVERTVVDAESGELTITAVEESDHRAPFTLRVNEDFWKWRDSFRIVASPW